MKFKVEHAFFDKTRLTWTWNCWNWDWAHIHVIIRSADDSIKFQLPTTKFIVALVLIFNKVQKLHVGSFWTSFEWINFWSEIGKDFGLRLITVPLISFDNFIAWFSVGLTRFLMTTYSENFFFNVFFSGFCFITLREDSPMRSLNHSKHRFLN